MSKTTPQLYNNTEFFSSGCTLLDLILGGGWPLGRVANIVGDRSSGKTLLAIEAFANFKRTYPKGRMRYAEAESAFDEVFAEQLGFPPTVEKPEMLISTVGEFEIDLATFCNELIKKNVPGIYVLDSLDALASDTQLENFEARLKGTKEKGSMGAEKAKDLSLMFSNLVKLVGTAKCTLIIISQIRDKIGVMFGETKTRSGGRALDFYASQVLWLAEIKKIEKTVRYQPRPIGVHVRGNIKKNKVGMPFRKADWQILFGYGIDDELSNIEWLKDAKAIDAKAYESLREAVEKARDEKNIEALGSLSKNLKTDVVNLWGEIETQLAPTMRKYS